MALGRRKAPRIESWTLDREALAWAAGFWDGEGCVYVMRPKGYHPCPMFDIRQSDPRVLERFRQAVGFGSRIKGPYRTGSGKGAWSYSFGGIENVQALLALVWTWLGPVKRQQATDALKEALQSYGTS